MARPPKCRIVQTEPSITYFKPRGIPMKGLKEFVLTVEGFEAIRLSDMEGLDQDEVAKLMGVSRQTVGRVLTQARKVVATALVEGHCIKIEGGTYQVATQQEKDAG